MQTKNKVKKTEMYFAYKFSILQWMSFSTMLFIAFVEFLQRSLFLLIPSFQFCLWSSSSLKCCSFNQSSEMTLFFHCHMELLSSLHWLISVFFYVLVLHWSIIPSALFLSHALSISRAHNHFNPNFQVLRNTFRL